MIETQIQALVADFLKNQYQWSGAASQVVLQETRKELNGDITVVLFPFLKVAKTNPVQLGNLLGNELISKVEAIQSFEVVQGFLNLSLSDHYWIDFIENFNLQSLNGAIKDKQERIVVEYSSPNTNKPLHLGHIRNILLGTSLSNLLEAAKYEVIRTQVINDRGIAICKSIVAWRLYGAGKTPVSENMKGDHFVGLYYVKFEQEFQNEYQRWQETDAGIAAYKSKGKANENQQDFYKRFKNEYFNQFSKLGSEAKTLLIAWESGEKQAIDDWKMMNQWVYEGFEQTYKRMNAHFDKNYYESDTYLVGRDYVLKGLEQGLFYQKSDQSVWANLEDRKLDQKILLRADGTSVYITQDIGTAQMRHEDFSMDRMIYVVGDEQEYHFKVLFELLDILGADYAKQCYHLAYGMVDLPTGRMKSREGKVVDADDLMEEVIETARQNAQEKGEPEVPEEEKKEIYRKIGLAALRYFILKVNPKKRMTFNPEESLDLQGQTGPYIQNAYVRIRSIQRKIGALKNDESIDGYVLASQEKDLIQLLSKYANVIESAANQYDPSQIANFAYDLAKSFHKFYHDISIQNEEREDVKAFRLGMIDRIAIILEHSMAILGIEMPERM